MLNGGYLVDGALCLSGGIHNQYYTELVHLVSFSHANKKMQLIKSKEAAYLIKKYEYDRLRLEDFVPNVDEFFDILLIAYNRQCLIGCTQNDVTICSNSLKFKLLTTYLIF
jgi:hypothetical protein